MLLIVTTCRISVPLDATVYHLSLLCKFGYEALAEWLLRLNGRNSCENIKPTKLLKKKPSQPRRHARHARQTVSEMRRENGEDAAQKRETIMRTTMIHDATKDPVRRSNARNIMLRLHHLKDVSAIHK